MPRPPTGPLAYVLLTLFCALVYLPGTTSFPPLDRDEARFAQATKQMLETGDFVGIHFQEDLRAKKPAGIYWMQAASVSALSDADLNQIWAYRIPSILGAWLAVLAVYAIGVRLFGPWPALAGAVLLGGSVVLIAEAQQAKTDAMLLFSVVCSQLALAWAWLNGPETRQGSGAASREPAPWWPMIAFWGGLGLGGLIKGPVGPAVILLTILALGLTSRRWRWLAATRPWPGFLLTVAIVAPWLVAVTVWTDPEFVTRAVEEDLWAKMVSGVESHGAPPGYFLLTMLVTFWPGSLLVLPALVMAWKRRDEPAVQFLLAWLVPGWLMFELVPTKLPHYVLPLYPALALLVATAVLGRREQPPAIFDRPWARIWYVLWGVIGVAGAAAIAYVPVIMADGFAWWGLPNAIVVLAAALVGVWLAWRARPVAALATVVACGVLWAVWTAEVYAERLDRLWLSRDVTEWLQAEAPPDARLASVGYHEPSLVFLAGTDTLLTDTTGAAGFLAGSPGAPYYALVPERREEAFLEALGEDAERARVEATFYGINYSRGDWLDLRLYRLEPAG